MNKWDTWQGVPGIGAHFDPETPTEQHVKGHGVGGALATAYALRRYTGNRIGSGLLLIGRHGPNRILGDVQNTLRGTPQAAELQNALTHEMARDAGWRGLTPGNLARRAWYGNAARRTLTGSGTTFNRTTTPGGQTVKTPPSWSGATRQAVKAREARGGGAAKMGLAYMLGNLGYNTARDFESNRHNEALARAYEAARKRQHALIEERQNTLKNSR
jgi:hypothetical protein